MALAIGCVEWFVEWSGGNHSIQLLAPGIRRLQPAGHGAYAIRPNIHS